MSPPVVSPHSKLLRLLAQIGLLILIWLAAVEISARWLPGLPPTVSGIAIALALLGLGLLRREWVADGAAWLLSYTASSGWVAEGRYA